MIGNNIKKFRKQLGLSQDDLAKMTCLSKRAIAYYEKEANNEIFEKLEIIANALNITVADLFKDNKPCKNNDIDVLDTRIIKKILKIKRLPVKTQNSIWEYIDFALQKNKDRVETN